jgi:malonyl-CoA O-methyltransferase
MIQSQTVARNFSRAATTYDRYAQLQKAWRVRVLEQALRQFPDSATILDIGCGTGAFATEANALRPHWRITNLDLAYGMCLSAQSAIQADAAALPIVDATFDGVVSNLCLQWVSDKPRALIEIARVLKPGAMAVVMTLAEHTLHELRAMDAPLRLLAMNSSDDYRYYACEAGLEAVAIEEAAEQHRYDSLGSLLHSFKAIGANAAFNDRGNLSPTSYQQLSRRYAAEYGHLQGGVVATWHPLLMVLRKQVNS